MTLIVNESRKKLSKRDESIIQFIEQYEELGYLPEALFNFITLLGWSPVGEEELFTKEQLVEIFDPARLSKSPALFDQQKLAWMNNQYVKQVETGKAVELALPHLVKSGRVSSELTESEMEWVTDLVSLYQEQMSFGAEIVSLSEIFFKDDIEFEEEAKEVLSEEQVPEVMQAFLQEVEAIENFQPDEIKKAIKAVQKGTGHKGKKLFMPIRAAVTGQTHGPDLPKAISLLGKEKIKQRLESILS